MDVENAINWLNCKVITHSIRITCPIIVTNAINTFDNQARLFILGGDEIISDEETTQGDPPCDTVA